MYIVKYNNNNYQTIKYTDLSNSGEWIQYSLPGNVAFS